MLSERMKMLLGKAADEFENGSNPFETWWLSENDVSLDECMSLSSYISIAIKAFVQLPDIQHIGAIARWARD